MNAEILDKRNEAENNCYLCKISLFDFITNLPEDYKNYDIQREIVSNIYLDSLVDTVLNFRHIPPIVLVIEKNNYKVQKSNLEISAFKILDGLQRTYRLKIIWDTIQFFEKLLKEDKNFIKLNRLQLSKKFSDKLYNINSSSKVLSYLIDFHQKHRTTDLKTCYQRQFSMV
ncbi:hypothetical protein [Ferruginibacter sp.]